MSFNRRLSDIDMDGPVWWTSGTTDTIPNAGGSSLGIHLDSHTSITSAESSTSLASKPTPALRRKNAIRSRRPSQATAATQSSAAEHLHPPTRQATKLHIATPRDIKRLSAQSITSTLSFASESSTDTASTAQSEAMPLTPPPVICDLPIQYTQNVGKFTKYHTTSPVARPSLRVQCGYSSPADLSPVSTVTSTQFKANTHSTCSQALSRRQTSRQRPSRQSTTSTQSIYSQPSPLDSTAYDQETSRLIRARMAERLAHRAPRRATTRTSTMGDSILSEASETSRTSETSEMTVRSEEWLWDRYFRVWEWERDEGGALARRRRREANDEALDEMGEGSIYA